MFNERLFRATVVLNGLTLSKVAELIGMHETTLLRKIQNNGSFSRKEINTLTDVLHLSDDDVLNIFFAQELT